MRNSIHGSTGTAGTSHCIACFYITEEEINKNMREIIIKSSLQYASISIYRNSIVVCMRAQ